MCTVASSTTHHLVYLLPTIPTKRGGLYGPALITTWLWLTNVRNQYTGWNSLTGELETRDTKIMLIGLFTCELKDTVKSGLEWPFLFTSKWKSKQRQLCLQKGEEENKQRNREPGLPKALMGGGGESLALLSPLFSYSESCKRKHLNLTDIISKQ